MATKERSPAPQPPTASGEPPRPALGSASNTLAALIAAGITLAGLAILFLFPYVTRHYRYPLGWDAPASIRAAAAVQVDGLERIGTIRAGAPLVFATLAATTRQNLFTLVAVVPALLAGVAGLGAAGMARAAFGIRIAWVPVFGVLTWAAFAGNGMLNLHLDNLMNSALTLGGFAAVLAFAAGGRGLVAATGLFMAAGMTHWPFFVLAMAVYLAGSAAVCGQSLLRGDRDEARTLAGALVRPPAVAGAFVGLTFLARPANGSIGARFGSLGKSLRERFFDRLHDPHTYYALPFAAAGICAGVSARDGSPSRAVARRLFVAFLLAWIGATLAGAVAEWLHVPTAGSRILLYAFPGTILTGVCVWWLGGLARSRVPGWGGLVVSALVVIAVVGGFAAVTVSWRGSQRPWIDPALVPQVQAAGAYLDGMPGTEPVAFLLGASNAGKPAIQTVRAVLGSQLADRVTKFYGTPEEYLSSPKGPGRPPTAFVLQRLGPAGYRAALQESPERAIAPGVILLEGALPAAPVSAPAVLEANLGGRNILWVCVAVVAVWYAIGGGWAMALLPSDPIVRAALAPALGLTAIALAGLTWDRVGLSLAGDGSIVPAVLVGLAGWAAAVVRILRMRRSAAA